jgi:hypothetical protein
MALLGLEGALKHYYLYCTLLLGVLFGVGGWWERDVFAGADARGTWLACHARVGAAVCRLAQSLQIVSPWEEHLQDEPDRQISM